MKNIFVTFGDGTKGWRDARQRILGEAKSTNLFDHCIGLDDNWLLEWFPRAFSIKQLFYSNNKIFEYNDE